MAAGLDTAAGAFAFLGATDVVIRTGKKIYGFLHDVIDALEALQRLRSAVKSKKPASWQMHVRSQRTSRTVARKLSHLTRVWNQP